MNGVLVDVGLNGWERPVLGTDIKIYCFSSMSYRVFSHKSSAHKISVNIYRNKDQKWISPILASC